MKTCPFDVLKGEKLDYFLTNALPNMSPSDFALVCNT